MISLAPLRYRNVLSSRGGPIAKVETGTFSMRGRPMVMANATLVPGLTRRRSPVLYGAVDGTGTDVDATVARHKAVSEAMERWAFHALVRSPEAAAFGFDTDPSSNGMAAFPGLRRRSARRSAVLEAVERFCLMSWWEGRAQARIFQTDWPGVSAAALDGPFGGVTVITYARTLWGGYVYGHAAEESFGAACERAVAELARHEWILRSAWLASAAGQPLQPTDIFERRCLFFASEEGHALFQERLHAPMTEEASRPDVIFDGEIPGPWSRYATVWRFALRPPSDRYLRGGARYFFL